MQQNRKTGQLFWLSVVTLIASFSILFYSLVYVRQQPTVVISALPQTPIAANQTVSMGVVDMRVSDVRANAGRKPFTAPQGKEYTIVTLYVKNRSDAPIQVLPSTDTYVKDSGGNIYYTSPNTLSNPFRAGQLSPGESIKGELSFLTPTDVSLKFYVDAIWSGGVIPFALDKS